MPPLNVSGHDRTVALSSGDTNVIVSGYSNDVVGTGSLPSTVDITGPDNAIQLGDGDAAVFVSGRGSNSKIVLGNGNDQLTLETNYNQAMLGGGVDSVAMTGSNETVTASGGPNTVTGGTGNSSVTLGGGTDNISLGGWANAVTVGNGDDTIDAGAGTATIKLGKGNDTVTLHGRNNTVTGGGGNDSVTGGGKADSVTLGDGNDTVQLGGIGNVIELGNGADTIVAGSGQDSVTAGGGTNRITLAGHDNVLVGGNGADDVSGSAGYSQILLGDGPDIVQAGGDGNIIKLGNGADTVTLSGVNNVVSGGDGGVTVTGGTSNNKITLGSGSNTVKLAGWGNSVTVDGGSSQVDAGLGTSSIVASGGQLALILSGHGDTVFLHGNVDAAITDQSKAMSLSIDSTDVVATITGFGAASGASVDLIGLGFTSVQQVLSALRSDGHGGTVLAYGVAGHVDFANLAASALRAASFIVGEPAAALQAEAPSLAVQNASGNQGNAIALTINAAQAETELPAANLSLTISGLQGASLNHGTHDLDGSYTLDLPELTGLILTPTAAFAGTLALDVVATDTEPSSGTTASSATQKLDVVVNPIAETPILSVQTASGNQGTAIPLTIVSTQTATTLALSDLTITVSGLQGATLNHGHRNQDGSFTLQPADLSGLTITPPAAFTGTLGLTVVAADTEPSSSTAASSAAQALSVIVNPAAEAPSLSVEPASGNEGAAIALTIAASQAAAALPAVDLTIEISGLQGATLNYGTLNGDGSYTLQSAYLADLTVTPAAGFTGTLAVTVTATDSEPASNTTASSSLTLDVAVYPLAEAPELAVQPASGAAGAAIGLAISASQAAPDLSPLDLMLTVSGLQGATLNHGTLNTDGSYTLQAGDVSSLTVTPATGFTGSLALSVTATDSEPASGTSASTASHILDVTVQPAVAPPLTPVFSLAAVDQIASAMQAETDAAYVSLAGQTTAGDTVTLVGTGAMAIADTSGAFEFDNVALIPGLNTLTVRASNSVGNVSTASQEIVRDAAILTAVTAPTDLTPLGFAPIGYHLDLTNLSNLAGTIQVEAFLSQTGSLSGNDQSIGGVTLSLTDLAGATGYDGQIELPASALAVLPFGDYQVVVQATLSLAASGIQETTNAATAPILYEPGYSARVINAPSTILDGNSIVLTGAATSTIDGSIVAFAQVDVTITQGNFQQTLTTTTDATGNLSVTYQTLPGSEGTYTVSARNPNFAAEDSAPESSFDVIGLAFVQNQLTIAAATGVAQNGTLAIDNPSDQALSGISATVSGVPDGWTFTLNDLPTTLAANSETTVDYTLDATTQSDLSSFTVEIAATDGAQDTATLNVVSQLTGPDLQVDASGLTTGVLVGGQTLLTFTITNGGQQAAHDVRLSLPQGLSWLQSASPENLGTIAAGAALTVSLLADPGVDMALGEYKGTIAVQYGADGGQNPTTSVPFDFNVTTDQTGSVALTLSDEATILTAAKPLVQDATVTVTDATGAVVATFTGVNGTLQIPDLTVGTYNLQISAANHSVYSQTIQITAGQTDTVNAFLPMEVATYNWSVVKSTVTDVYSIQLDSTFETDVPVPVVTINPPTLDFADLGYGQSKVIDLTMTNHGLIAANDVSLNLPSPPGYVITPMVNSLPEIAADSSVLVPVTITRLPPSVSAASSQVAAAAIAVTQVAAVAISVADPIVVNSIPGLMPPPSIDPIDWGLIETRLQIRFGTTTASANNELTIATEVLQQIGQPTSEPSTFLAYEVEAAAGLLPNITLASTTDLAESGTGIDLSLTRTYSANLLDRNDAGTFGDGWTSTFDVAAAADSSGNVYITSSSGTEVFMLNSDGSYSAQAGDDATLTLKNGNYILTEADGTVEKFGAVGVVLPLAFVAPNGAVVDLSAATEKLSSITDPNGNAVIIAYDSSGNITRVTDTNGQSLAFTTNVQGRITTVTDQTGQTVTYTYDSSGQHLLNVSSPAGTTSYSYSTDSNALVQNALTQITNPDGTTQTFEYDSQGNLSAQSGPGGTGAINYSYGAIGTVKETDAAGNATTLVYDANGNLTEAIDPSGAVTSLTYDASGDLTGISSTTGASYQFGYSDNGNLETYTDPDGSVVTAIYVPGTSLLTSLTDQNGDTTRYTYDAAGDLTGVTQADGSGTT